VEAMDKATDERPIYDSRLCPHGNQLLKTTEQLSLQQNIFVSQYRSSKTQQLVETERLILEPKLERVSSKARIIVSLIDHK
jgi:hypothetical protein